MASDIHDGVITKDETLAKNVAQAYSKLLLPKIMEIF